LHSNIFLISHSQSDIDEIEKEINILSDLHYNNIVLLNGVYSNPNAKDSKGNNLDIRILMEFCENGSLRKYLNSNPKSKLELDLIIRILVDASQGIEYLHTHKPISIIHRDIKSNNILLDSILRAKDVDFGLANEGTYCSTKVICNRTKCAGGSNNSH